jgi:hypothetical protein
MGITTIGTSYIIVLGIVISVLPISLRLLQDGYHVRFQYNSKQKTRGANQTSWITSKQLCPINLLSDGLFDAFSSSDTIPAIISEPTETISDHSYRCTLLQEGGFLLWLCEAVSDHLSSRYAVQVDLSISRHICNKGVLGYNVCNCSSAVNSVPDTRDG